MYIQIEKTPNENALKFLVEGLTAEGSIFDYVKNFSEEKPIFVIKLFEIEGIERVFFTSEFVTITKSTDADFEIIKPLIFQTLLEAKMHQPVQENRETPNLEDFDEISKQIIDLIEERITPAVAMDGGRIEFVKFEAETGIVYLRLKGSCSGCPSAEVTLKQGVERTLQHYIPEVKEVQAI